MLTSIRQSDSIKVRARFSSKNEKPFLCPECFGETILKKGRIKIPHFAHKPPFDCKYGVGEKEIHRKAKEEIYEEICKSKMVSFCELEYELKISRPDIYFEFDNIKIAIEIQVSNFTLDEIMNRTWKYYDQGIYVLWLPLFNEKLRKNKYSPKSWEKWLHALNYGKIFYWKEKLTVVPVKFNPFKLYVEESSWYEDGEERTAGGYHRFSKRYRTPSILPGIDLLKDFQAVNREQWDTDNILIPKSKIYLAKNT